MSGRRERLEQMLELDPSDTFVLYALAQEHTKAGDDARAIEYYDRCIDADPDHAYAYFHKALSQQTEGDAEQARQTVTQGLEAARRAGDAKAESELAALLEQLDHSA